MIRTESDSGTERLLGKSIRSTVMSRAGSSAGIEFLPSTLVEIAPIRSTERVGGQGLVLTSADNQTGLGLFSISAISRCKIGCLLYTE
jgi:hypothetical protein